MKKIVYTCLFAMATLCGCDNYLDLTPKGSTLLNELDDLELLLNSNYQNSAWSYNDLNVITNESYGRNVSPATVIANHNGLEYIYMAYDENMDRLQYSTSNFMYTRIYSSVNYMNIFLSKVDELEGDEARKVSLKAEARIMRAYFHYILVNVFAKQYDEKTSKTEGGIPYVTNTSITDTKPKLTLSEVYEKLLEDCDEAVIENLPDKAVNIQRPGKAFGHAVRAKILFQMKKYAEALISVNKSLTIQNVVDDRTPVITERLYKRDREASNNLFWAAGTASGAASYILSQETSQLLEEGDIILNYGLSKLNGDNKEIWNTTNCEPYKLGIDGTIYMWSNGSNYMTNMGGITCEQLRYLKAECLIRTDKIKEGLNEVNSVRKYRIDPAVYQDLTATTEQEAMALLRKAKWIECLFTYNNFFDMKRWNTEDAYKTTITRVINGTTYTLKPESPLWIIPFPTEATDYNPTLTQNY